tara:strand:+ start:3229 stop:4749 length:1521 start_codon:yes stop_codon:yes gene_type:complete
MSDNNEKSTAILPTDGGWVNRDGNTGTQCNDEWGWQVRVSIKPTRDNLTKALRALEDLMPSLAHYGYKLTSVCEDGPNRLLKWDGTQADASDRDQRGKELNIYLPGNQQQGFAYDNSEDLKYVLMTVWKALDDAGVEMSYITPSHDEQEIPSAKKILSPFSYSANKPYQSADGILFAENYNPNNFSDPLEDIKISLDDIEEYGISNYHSFDIIRQRVAYMQQHDNEQRSRIKQDIRNVLEAADESAYEVELRTLKERLNSDEDVVEILRELKDRVDHYHSIFPSNFVNGGRLPIIDAGHAAHLLEQELVNQNEVRKLITGWIEQIEAKPAELVENEALKAHFSGREDELRSIASKDPRLLQSIARQLVHLERESNLIVRENQRYVELQSYFKDNAPASYKELTGSGDNNLSKARALLADYTKNDSALARFFTGHWNRHHVSTVNNIVNKIDNNQYHDIHELLSELYAINNQNLTGSLARRITFIETLLNVDDYPMTQERANVDLGV